MSNNDTVKCQFCGRDVPANEIMVLCASKGFSGWDIGDICPQCLENIEGLMKS